MAEVGNSDAKLGVTLCVFHNGNGGNFLINNNGFNGYYQ
jgi:hypothetical protein